MRKRKVEEWELLTQEQAVKYLQLKMEQERQAAYSDFARFLDYSNPQYDRQWFHTQIARKCQKLYEGEIKKLMIFMPPQHGKSEIISKKFPEWVIGHNRDIKIVSCSYSSNLSEQFSRTIQHEMNSPEYKSLFDNVTIGGKGYKKNADLFEVNGTKGFYKAVGVTGSLTGTPADLAIIDDPVKDALEAYSPTYRERVWDWYTSVLCTRLYNESRQLLVMTRWHEDDLAGRILKREANEWTVVSIPAIRETLDDGNVKDERQVGEALWESRHSITRLKAAQQRSPRWFSALYQQHPTTDGGNIIRREWFNHISKYDFMKKHDDEPIHFFLDTAYTESKANDPSGIIGACKIGTNIYIVHGKKVNMNFPNLCRFLPDYMRSHGYTRQSTLRIEPKANGLSVIDQLRETTNLNVTRTPTPRDSKETRLNAISPYIESGRIYLVDDDWTDEFIEEVCGFPAQPHDEYVDVLCYAVNFNFGATMKLSDTEILQDFL